MFMHFSYFHEALKIFNYEDFKFDQRWVLKYLTYAKESYKANVVVCEGQTCLINTNCATLSLTRNFSPLLSAVQV